MAINREAVMTLARLIDERASRSSSLIRQPPLPDASLSLDKCSRHLTAGRSRSGDCMEKCARIDRWRWKDDRRPRIINPAAGTSLRPNQPAAGRAPRRAGARGVPDGETRDPPDSRREPARGLGLCVRKPGRTPIWLGAVRAAGCVLRLVEAHGEVLGPDRKSLRRALVRRHRFD